MEFNIEAIRKKMGEIALKPEDIIRYNIQQAIEKIAIEHFGVLPYMRKLGKKDEVSDDFIGEEPEDENFEDNLEYDEESIREAQNKIDLNKTLTKIINEIPETIVLRIESERLEDAALFNPNFIYYDEIFYLREENMPQELLDCVVEKEDKPRIRWILRTSRGTIQNKYMDITPRGDDEENYNDDFKPINEKINNLINRDESSIIILHGKPGTGKTSYIRNLIAKNSNINFYWIDSTMFSYIDSAEFIEFISSCKNAVFILEDSEILLTSREESKNPAMQTLLSISDGMLGDSLKLKFICTFNTDLQNIDSAILRKGRMKVKYEFKDLDAEKVKKIFIKEGIDPKLAKAMPLCDIYNYFDDNGYENTKPNKIGF